MSDLVERVEKAVMEISVCGVTVDGVRMLCCDERVKGLPEYWPPEDCDCHNYARYVRDIVLEEAAKVAQPKDTPPCDVCVVLNDDGQWISSCTCLDWDGAVEAGQWCALSNARAAIKKLGEE